MDGFMHDPSLSLSTPPPSHTAADGAGGGGGLDLILDAAGGEGDMAWGLAKHHTHLLVGEVRVPRLHHLGAVVVRWLHARASGRPVEV